MTAIENTNYLEKFGGRLLRNGYPIVPIKPGYKFPKGLSGWEQITATENHLKKWLANGFANGGVGVLTKYTPAVDVDVQDSDVVAQVVAWCEEHLGPTVQRVGMAPKVLLAYRTDEPFTKVASKTYEDMFGLRHRLEILGDGQQFVAFATHPDTEQPYQWITEDSLADVPRDALPVLTAEKAQALIDYFESNVPDDWEVVEQGQSGKRVDDDLSPEDRLLMNHKPKVAVSADRLRACLEQLDADDYHQWVKVGMALFHQFDGDAEGMALWDEWSQNSDKYDADSIPAKWRTFDANLTRQEPVTAATILRMARLADEQDAGGDWVDRFIEQYVYVQDGDRVADLHKPPHCSVSRLAEFRNRTANVRHEVPAPTAKDPDNVKLEPVWKSWMVQPQRKSAEGTMYVPKEGRVITDNYGLDWINEFHMPEFASTEDRDRLGVFFDHMAYLFPVDVEREWFISWMAFNLQYPERRSKVTPLHVSVAHGTGRGWVVECLGKLLGQWNLKKTKMNVLAGDGNGAGFHEFLHNSLMCAIEEVKEGNKRFSVSDRIRDLLTENHLEVNIKYGGKKTQQVFTNFFFMSNHPDALVLTTQDRRINVFSGPDTPKDRAYYDRLYAWLDTDGVSQLYSFLMARDLSGFDWVRSMDTEARTRMIQNNRTETEVLFWELMDAPPYPVMTFQQIVSAMRDLSDKDAFDVEVEEGQLTKLLQHHAEHVKALKVEGKTIRPWLLVRGAAFDNDEIRQFLTQCGL